MADNAPPPVVSAPTTATIGAPPAAPAETPASLSDAFDAAFGNMPLSAEAATPASKLPAEAAVPAAPVAPAAPQAPATPAVPATPATPATPAAPADPNDPFSSLSAAAAPFSPAETPATPAASDPLPTLPEDAPEKTKTAFATVTRKLSDSEKTILDLKAEIAAKGTPDAKIPELEKMLETERTKSADMEKWLERVNLEASPKFQAEIMAPINQVAQSLEALALTNDTNSGVFLKAAQTADPVERRKMIKEATSEWDPVDALEARTQVEQLVQLAARRETVLSNAKQNAETYKADQEKAVQSRKDKFAAEADAAYEDTWPKFLKALPMLQPQDDNPEFNAMVSSIKAKAKAIDAAPLSHAQRAALTYQAVSLPIVLNALRQIGEPIFAENKALKAQIAGLLASTPGAGSGSTSSGAQDLPSEMGLVEAMEKRMVGGV
ncbi:MAG: hypothetical protein ABI162_07010 [Luteolibacter sp.]